MSNDKLAATFHPVSEPESTGQEPPIPTRKDTYPMTALSRQALAQLCGAWGHPLTGVLEVHAYADRVEVITYAPR